MGFLLCVCIHYIRLTLYTNTNQNEIRKKNEQIVQPQSISRAMLLVIFFHACKSTKPTRACAKKTVATKQKSRRTSFYLFLNRKRTEIITTHIFALYTVTCPSVFGQITGGTMHSFFFQVDSIDQFITTIQNLY